MNGRDHARLARYAGLLESAAAVVYLYAGGHPEIVCGVAAGAFCGWLITPDADHHARTFEERRVEHIPLLGPYLLEVWAGYGAKRRHRGRSHWHVWGTITRIVYFGRRFSADILLAVYVGAVLLGGGQLDGEMVRAALPYLPGTRFFLSAFLAWTIQDSIHIESDRLWSWWRSLKGRRARRRLGWAVLWLLVLTTLYLSRG